MIIDCKLNINQQIKSFKMKKMTLFFEENYNHIIIVIRTIAKINPKNKNIKIGKQNPHTNNN